MTFIYVATSLFSLFHITFCTKLWEGNKSLLIGPIASVIDNIGGSTGGPEPFYVNKHIYIKLAFANVVDIIISYLNTNILLAILPSFVIS